jgi:hypothetical protein
MTYNPNQNGAPAPYIPGAAGYTPAPAQPAPYGGAPVFVPPGFDDAKPRGERSEYIGAGLHMLEVRAAKIVPSRKGPVFFVMEFKCQKSEDLPGEPIQTSHREGDDLALSMNMNGDYAGEIKSVLAQLLGGNPNDVKGHHVQWCASEQNPLAGTIVEVAGRTRPDPKKPGDVRRSEKTGQPYVNFKFRVLQPGPALAVAAAQAGA